MGFREYIRPRRHLIVGAVILLASGSIVFAVHRKNQFDLRTDKYVSGINILKGEDALENLDVAEKLFTEIADEGDARGDFGLACVMYKRDAGSHAKSELVKSKMEYAANHGSLAARAALVSYYAIGYGTPINLNKANRLLFSVLMTAQKSISFGPTDSTLSAIFARLGGGRRSSEFIWQTLMQGLCAPALSNADIVSVMKNRPKPYGPLDERHSLDLKEID